MQNQDLKGQQLLCTLGNLLQILWPQKQIGPVTLVSLRSKSSSWIKDEVGEEYQIEGKPVL